jgi:UDP-N-acetylmuramyl pentapeptide phosphotransferase/UDP-N-acetylglucosamine-1-phosphate transferase
MLIGRLRSWLSRVAAATPNARSSHQAPTPQGGGLGLIAALLATALPAIIALGVLTIPAIACLLALAGLCALGFADDRRPLDWRAKLLVQALAALVAAGFLPSPAIPDLPAIVGTALAGFFLLAVVNIVNFIDGIDEITVAHAAPPLALAALAGFLGAIALSNTLLAAAGLGATLGFWTWNRHPARIFLGDAGSLPLGLLLGWLALSLLHAGAWSAAALLLLYPLVDGVMTLVRRARRGAALTQPHRDHAYQQAVDTGVPPPRVAATVALVSAGNAVLALVTLAAPHRVVAIGALLIGLTWTLLPILAWLRRPRR